MDVNSILMELSDGMVYSYALHGSDLEIFRRIRDVLIEVVQEIYSQTNEITLDIQAFTTWRITRKFLKESGILEKISGVFSSREGSLKILYSEEGFIKLIITSIKRLDSDSMESPPVKLKYSRLSKN